MQTGVAGMNTRRPEESGIDAARNMRAGIAGMNTVHSMQTEEADANQEILDNTKEGEICGSTAIVLWIQENAWAVFSCGDSRCYHVYDSLLKKRVIQLTTDDVWENQQQNICDLSTAEIQQDVNFGRLIRAVGTNSNFSCSVRSDQMKDRTVFALCSDGIYKVCPERFLKKCLKKAMKTERLKTCVEEIKNEVYQNGAPDNLSLILVHVSV